MPPFIYFFPFPFPLPLPPFHRLYHDPKISIFSIPSRYTLSVLSVVLRTESREIFKKSSRTSYSGICLKRLASPVSISLTQLLPSSRDIPFARTHPACPAFAFTQLSFLHGLYHYLRAGVSSFRAASIAWSKSKKVTVKSYQIISNHIASTCQRISFHIHTSCQRDKLGRNLIDGPLHPLDIYFLVTVLYNDIQPPQSKLHPNYHPTSDILLRRYSNNRLLYLFVPLDFAAIVFRIVHYTSVPLSPQSCSLMTTILRDLNNLRVLPRIVPLNYTS